MREILRNNIGSVWHCVTQHLLALIACGAVLACIGRSMMTSSTKSNVRAIGVFLVRYEDGTTALSRTSSGGEPLAYLNVVASRQPWPLWLVKHPVLRQFLPPLAMKHVVAVGPFHWQDGTYSNTIEPPADTTGSLVWLAEVEKRDSVTDDLKDLRGGIASLDTVLVHTAAGWTVLFAWVILVLVAVASLPVRLMHAIRRAGGSRQPDA